MNTPPGPAHKGAVVASELVQELRRLHQDAGRPSYRKLGDKCTIGHTTLGRLFKGEHIPKWVNVRSVVTALGGDVDKAAGLWEAATGKVHNAAPRQPQWTLPEPGTPLTEREQTILHRLSYGDGRRVIARRLFLSEESVRSYIRRIYVRLGAANRAHAIRLGFERRYLAMDTSGDNELEAILVAARRDGNLGEDWEP